MKIRQQRPGHTDLETWIDEDVRLVGSCRNASIALRSCKRQRAHRGGTDSDDAAFVVECAIDLCSRGFGDAETLVVHLVLFNFCDAYRLKRSETHMQSDFSNLNPALTDRGQSLRREMQTRGWRGHTAFLLRVDSLIPVVVRDCVSPGDVFRQRNMGHFF